MGQQSEVRQVPTYRSSHSRSPHSQAEGEVQVTDTYAITLRLPHKEMK